MRSRRPKKLPFPALLAVALASAVACVPPGNATPDDAGTTGTAAPTSTLPKPPPNVLTTVFEDNFERPEGGAFSTGDLKLGAGDGPLGKRSSGLASLGLSGEGGAGDGGNGNDNAASTGADGGSDAGVRMRRYIETLPDGAMVLRTVAEKAPPERPREDKGEDRTNIGPNWQQAQTNAWHIEDGWLCVENAHNHGIWFARPIPINARIEWDAKSDSPDGDLKAELWGDGRGFAKGNSYNDATSYLAILGGWKNTLHVLARLDEHKDDRKVVHVDKDSDDPRQRPVMRGQVYHIKVERNDAKTVRYYVDTLLMATFLDTEPLMGPGHDHFGFNDWEAKVCFDNVKITPLP